MRLYFVLFLLPFWGNNNLWIVQKPLNRNDQLIAKETDLNTLLTENNLTIKDLSADEQAVLQKTVTGLYGGDNIGKGKFLKTAKKLLSKVAGESDPFGLLGDERRLTHSLDAEKLNKVLTKRASASSTPLEKEFLDELKKEIPKGKTIDVRDVKEALKKVLKKVSDPKYLKKHYDDNKAAYKQSAEDDSSGFDNIDPIDLQTGLDDLTTTLKLEIEETIDDPKFPPNAKEIEKQKAEEKQREKERKQRKEDFKLAYAAWRKRQISSIASMNKNATNKSAEETLPKHIALAFLLELHNDFKKPQRELSTSLMSSIVTYIAGIKEKPIKTSDYINAINFSIMYADAPIDKIELNWYEDKNMPNYSYIEIFLGTYNANNSKQYQILAEYLEWIGDIGNPVDSLNLPPNQLFVTENLQENIKKIFSTKELAFFIPFFEESLHKHNQEVLSLSNVSTLWTNTMIKVISYKQFADIALPNYNAIKDKTFFSTISDKLQRSASLDTLKKMLLDASISPTKKTVLKKGAVLGLTYLLNDRTELIANIRTDIIEAGKLDNKKVYYASPSSINLAVHQGNKAYTYEAKNFLAHSPVIINANSVRTNFEFRIYFSKATTTNNRNIEQVNNNTKTTNITLDAVSKGLLFFLETDEAIMTNQHVSYTTSKKLNTNIKHSETSLSEGFSKEFTTELGNEQGYIEVSGYLLSEDIDKGGTLIMNFDGVQVNTSGMKSMKILKGSMETDKTVRWDASN